MTTLEKFASLEDKVALKNISYSATLHDGRCFWISLTSMLDSPSDWVLGQEITQNNRGDVPPAIIRKSEIATFTYYYQNQEELYGEEEKALYELFKFFVEGVKG